MIIMKTIPNAAITRIMKRIWGLVKLAEMTTSAAEIFRNPVPKASTSRFRGSGPPKRYPMPNDPRMKRAATSVPSRPRSAPARIEKSLVKRYRV